MFCPCWFLKRDTTILEQQINRCSGLLDMMGLNPSWKLKLHAMRCAYLKQKIGVTTQRTDRLSFLNCGRSDTREDVSKPRAVGAVLCQKHIPLNKENDEAP
jgi:hypothetical protein